MALRSPRDHRRGALAGSHLCSLFLKQQQRLCGVGLPRRRGPSCNAELRPAHLGGVRKGVWAGHAGLCTHSAARGAATNRTSHPPRQRRADLTSQDCIWRTNGIRAPVGKKLKSRSQGWFLRVPSEGAARSAVSSAMAVVRAEWTPPCPHGSVLLASSLRLRTGVPRCVLQEFDPHPHPLA